MSVNKAIILGYLGKDPEIRYMPNGEAVANFSIATSETWKDKSGAKQEKTEWHNIVAYKKLAEIVGQYVKKGSLIYIEGKITTEKWQDKEGHDRYTTKIIANEMKMLGGKSGSKEVIEPKQVDIAEKQESPLISKNDFTSFDNFDSDIPF